MLSRAASFSSSSFVLGATLTLARGAAAQEEVVVRGDSSSAASGFSSRAKLDDAPREITDTASLVQPLPGVHVRRLGPEDSFATVSVRGTTSSQVAVYLAGVPLSGGADPTLDLATLPLLPGAQVRVFRSFAPAALGPGSLGGTLVLDPPSARTPIPENGRTDVWAAVGSYGARRLRIGDARRVSSDPNGVRVATALSASRSDNDFTYLDPLSSYGGHDVFRTRENAGHAQASGLASVAVPIDLAGPRDGALTLTTLAQARKQELPGTIHGPTPYQRLDSSRLLSALELSLPAGVGAASIRGWGRREGLAIHDAPGAIPGPSSSDDAILAAGGSVGWRGAPAEGASIEARVNGSAERFAPGTWIGATTPPAARRTSAGAALDASARVLERTTLAASARGDFWFDTSGDGSSDATARPTAHAGVEQRAGPIVLATHAGILTRPASFIERYGNRGAFIGDPHLRPESARTIDAGARTDVKLGALLLHAELAAFATWAQDLIVFVPVGFGGRAKATNIGAARIGGLEGYVRARAWGFDVRLSHTALATVNEAECCPRPPLPGRPEHDFVGNLAWRRGPVRLRYGLDVMTGMRADVAGSIVVPPRVLHSAGAQLTVPGVRGLTLSLQLWNLFDLRAVAYPNALGGTDRYPIGDLYDYPLPGRRFLLAAQWVTQ